MKFKKGKNRRMTDDKIVDAVVDNAISGEVDDEEEVVRGTKKVLTDKERKKKRRNEKKARRRNRQ